MSIFKISPSATQFKQSGDLAQESIDRDSINKKSQESGLILGGVEQFNLSPPEIATKPTPTMSESLFAPKAPMLDKKGFLSILEQLGVSGEGLALNEIGKAQLVSRLQAILGKEYSKNPLALDAMSAFDKEISKYPMDTKKGMAAMVSNGERTLKELLKG